MTDRHPALDELIELAHRDDPATGEGAAKLAHVRSCPDCEELFVPLRLLVVGARSRRRRRWTLGLATAAAGGLALAMVVFADFSILATGPTGPEASRPAQSQAGPGQSRRNAAGSPVDPASLADPGPVDPRLVDFRISIIGGTPVSDRTRLFDLRRGWEALGESDHDTAVEIFERLLRQRPTDMEAAGMLGVASYLTGDDSARTEALLERGAEQRPGILQRLPLWYLANLRLRRGDTDEAVATLELLQDEELNDSFTRRADALLERIDALRTRGPRD